MRLLFVLVCFAAQLLFFISVSHVKAELGIVPLVIGEKQVDALSLGDRQFYFRLLGFKIQNAGDSFGRFTALREYDYTKLEQWFYLLDKIDSASDFIPTLAGHYFSQTQNNKDVIHIVNYLRNHAKKDLSKKWWWLIQAAFLADTRLDDKNLALEISYEITQLPDDAPPWAKYFPSIILAQIGDKRKAEEVMKMLVNNYDDISEQEWRFIKYFIQDRLGGSYDTSMQKRSGNL
ncbi:hypothetical protein [Candidatus Xenohaliotis californiensis]